MAKEKTAIGNRFKRYEEVSDVPLVRRTPVIGRIDGRAFHTLTRNCAKPFDKEFHRAMLTATEYLVKDVQGCKFAYTQSDEISLLLTDYETVTTDAWFDYRVQKMCAIAACLATLGFNNAWNGRFAIAGMFDARFFNVPENDVVNYFIWRQRDAERNSINSLAQAHFSHKSLQGLNTSQVQERLMVEKGINWNDVPTCQKRGTSVYYENQQWVYDEDIPIFAQNREFISRFLPQPEQAGERVQ